MYASYLPTRIVSGGQNGADRGFLYAAKLLGIETGGTAPAHFRTERGENPLLGIHFGLVAHESYQYPPRTRLNVQNSDATLIIVRHASVGSMQTAAFCRDADKPYYWLELPNLVADVHSLTGDVQEWMMEHQIQTLNGAGNRESVAPGIQTWVQRFVRALYLG